MSVAIGDRRGRHEAGHPGRRASKLAGRGSAAAQESPPGRLNPGLGLARQGRLCVACANQLCITRGRRSVRSPTMEHVISGALWDVASGGFGK